MPSSVITLTEKTETSVNGGEQPDHGQRADHGERADQGRHRGGHQAAEDQHASRIATTGSEIVSARREVLARCVSLTSS